MFGLTGRVCVFGFVARPLHTSLTCLLDDSPESVPKLHRRVHNADINRNWYTASRPRRGTPHVFAHLLAVGVSGPHTIPVALLRP